MKQVVRKLCRGVKLRGMRPTLRLISRMAPVECAALAGGLIFFLKA